MNRDIARVLSAQLMRLIKPRYCMCILISGANLLLSFVYFLKRHFSQIISCLFFIIGIKTQNYRRRSTYIILHMKNCEKIIIFNSPKQKLSFSLSSEVLSPIIMTLYYFLHYKTNRWYKSVLILYIQMRYISKENIFQQQNK